MSAASSSSPEALTATARERLRPMTIDEILLVLEDSPGRIAALTAGLPAARLQRTPVLGEWSVNDVLAHLRSCSDARGEFIREMLAEKRPTLRAVNPRTLIERTNYRELPFDSSFRAFARQRARLVSFLKPLSRASWSRTALVTGGGPSRERTVQFYGQWLARHERSHVKQLTRALRPQTRD
jgi:DinB family protein